MQPSRDPGVLTGEQTHEGVKAETGVEVKKENIWVIISFLA